MGYYYYYNTIDAITEIVKIPHGRFIRQYLIMMQPAGEFGILSNYLINKVFRCLDTKIHAYSTGLHPVRAGIRILCISRYCINN